MRSLKNMFDILTDELPTEWEGVQIKTDFRQVLKFFKLLKDDKLTEQEKVILIIKIFFEDIPKKQDNLWEFINWYINLGKNEEQESGRKVFDFEIDNGRIYSAFQETYNINLINLKMHWWVFFTLFENLSSETRLMQVIELRGKKPSKNDSNEYKLELAKMQAKYRIDDEKQSLAGFFGL